MGCHSLPERKGLSEVCSTEKEIHFVALWCVKMLLETMMQILAAT